MLESYVALDLEMTGLSVKDDRIIEIGAVRVTDKKTEEKLSIIINPHMVLKPDIEELTGLTNEDVAQGVEIEDGLTSLFEFLGESVIVGHNIGFDCSFIAYAAANLKMHFNPKVVDTLKIARYFLPAEDKKTLSALVDRYNIPRSNAHRGYDDALSAGLLYEVLGKEYLGKDEKGDKLFEPRELNIKVKKKSPITKKQINDLTALISERNIMCQKEIKSLTKNEASRYIDIIKANPDLKVLP